MADTKTKISIYLNDHLAMITGEIELANRVAAENEATPLAAFLEKYVDEVRRQQSLIEASLVASGGEKSTLKQAAGWLLEKIGRLKTNDALLSYSDLTRVVELEALTSAANARRLLWETLSDLPSSMTTGPMVGGAEALANTSSQLTQLDEFHRAAVQLAFQDDESG